MNERREFDAVVIGAGPAGSAVAITLAAAGWAVALIEKAAFPRHKVCGEFLSPACRALLARLGVWSDVERFHPPEIPELVLASRQRALRAEFPPTEHGLPFGLSRHALDDVLMRRAREAGATVFSPGIVRSLDDSACASAGDASGVAHSAPAAADSRDFRGSVTVNASSGAYSLAARHLIVADGLARGLASPPGVRGETARQIGVKTHFSGVEFSRGAIEVHALARAYVGMSPIEAGRVTVCAAVDVAEFRGHANDPRRWFDAARRQNKRFGSRVEHATQLMDWLVSPLPRYLFRTVRPGILAVGAAATALDPIIGEGMRTAMESGIRLAETLLEMPHAPPARVRDALRRRLNPRFRLRDQVARGVFMLSRHDLAASVVLAGLSLARPLLNTIIRASGK